MPLCKERKQWHQCATSKICSVLFRMLSLCCLVSSVVDHMLLISGGVFMIVRVLFWGHSVVIFLMGGFASGLAMLLCFISSFLVIALFLVYSCKKIKHHYSTGYPMKCVW